MSSTPNSAPGSSPGTGTVPMVSSRLYRAVHRVDVAALAKCSDIELRPVLASLVRMSLIASLDGSARCVVAKTSVLEVLSRIELVNNLVALLSIDFHALEVDVRKEQSLRAKLAETSSNSAAEGASVLIGSLTLGPALEFERSDATRRLRLVLSELLAIMGQMQSQQSSDASSSSTSSSNSTNSITMRPSELFDHIVYLSEVCDVLAIAMAELPSLLSPSEVSEALLRLKYGPNIICHVVANQPDSFRDVALHLLKNGDKQDDENPLIVAGTSSTTSSNQLRQSALLLLCEMHPSEVVSLRAKCVEWCKMPSLALMLTLEEQKRKPGSPDLVAFISGLLLGNDPQVRNWISFFIRNGQKKRNAALAAYRAALLERLRETAEEMNPKKKKKVIPVDLVVRASALLRLYTALRGIAGMKFSEDEVSLLLDLITSHSAPPTPAGVKFVSLGLCILLACNSLIAGPALEKRAVEWLRWLIREEHSFEQKSGVAASFGEMLLLMAIHFHSNQLGAICELVCQTIGMKIQIRTNGMTRMKTIFTQEIFTEQVVAAHAVRVPVTPALGSKITGFLPVHCIHQLLKSRTFSKHKVPIKAWIYRQMCASATPLHNVMPALIEIFVSSVLVPTTTGGGRGGVIEQTNEPISEAEIRAVFKRPVFENPKNKKEGTPMKTPKTEDPTTSLTFNLSAQILTLYYVLQYEHVRLNHMRAILTGQRKVLRYSKELLAELPIKFLLRAAERDQTNFGGVYPQLIRLCSTQYPHLCLVEDWLDDAEEELEDLSGVRVSVPQIQEAFDCLQDCPTMFTLATRRLLAMRMRRPDQLWKYAEVLCANARELLEPDTPRQARDQFSALWFELNKVFPRKLWPLTVNGLMHGESRATAAVSKRVSHEDLMLDPLQVLRVDQRVFRAGPMLQIVIYVLKACLAASRTHLSQHIQENPIFERAGNNQVSSDLERESLRDALIATQDSAAAQVLLECVNPTSEEEEKGDTSALTDLREVQGLVCSYLHESFIADPNLAKLVHFQGYPLHLLSVTVPGVPSMHICLDFAAELLSLPDLEKQAFAVDLISHLSIQYSLPKSYSTARLAVNALSTLITVLTQTERHTLFPPILPSLVRFCRAFPPLIEDVVGLLLQYGKICVSESCFGGYSSPRTILGGDLLETDKLPGRSREEVAAMLKGLPEGEAVAEKIQGAFKDIIDQCLMERRAF